MTSRPNFAFPTVRPALVKKLGWVLAAVMSLALAYLAFFFFRVYLESREVRAYVGGPFGSQLLYVQGCAPSATGGGLGATGGTLEEQFDSCRQPFGGRPGYYIYDFNIKRSVALSERDMENWRKYAIFSFPTSIMGRVEKSQTNPFNTIVPLEDFPGFKYDCSLDEDGEEAGCSVAPLKCDVRIDAIQCHVLDPNTGNFEHHLIEKDKGLEILVPQGFISGPDLYKLLKPRFFPNLDRM